MKYNNAVKDEDGNVKSIVLRIDGKKFACPCKGNVFHQPDQNDLHKYICNSCGNEFIAEGKEND